MAAEHAQQAQDMGMPGLPTHVVGMLNDLPTGVCGRCSAFPFGGDEGPPAAGMCSERGFEVRALDPACPMFLGRDEF